MSGTPRLSDKAKQRFAEKAAKHGLPNEFAERVAQGIAWDLQKDARAKLRYCTDTGCHEYRYREEWGDQGFVTIWEMDWNRSAGTLDIVSVEIVPSPPKLCRNAPKSDANEQK